MKILWQVVACFLWLFASVAVFSQSKPAADLIITNAKVWTVDKSNPTAQAVAVLGERIVAVGSNAAVEPWRGSNTKVLDAGGKLLLPGFNDSHVHFIDGGMQLDAVQLNDVTSPQEFTRRIAEKAGKTAKGEWMTGGDWDETKWTPDHTHDAIVTLTKTPDGAERIRRLYGEEVLIVLYVMPGFVLARKVRELTAESTGGKLRASSCSRIFNFGDDARTSYERMIGLVTEAGGVSPGNSRSSPGSRDGQPRPTLSRLAGLLRKRVSQLRAAVLAQAVGRPGRSLCRWPDVAGMPPAVPSRPTICCAPSELRC